MASRIVQVPMEDEEAQALAGVARRLGRSRAELIRTACRQYLDRLAEVDRDVAYEAGYRSIPEATELAETSAALAGTVLPREHWS